MRFNASSSVLVAMLVLISSNSITVEGVEQSKEQKPTNLVTQINNNETEISKPLPANVQNQAASLASTLSATLRSTFSSIDTLLHSLVHNLDANLSATPDPSEKSLDQLTSRFVNALEVFINKVLDASDALIRDIFNNIHVKLLQVQHEFQQLVLNVDDKFDWAVTFLNESLMNNTETLDLWAANVKQSLRTVNDTRFYTESCQIIDEYVQVGTEQLQKCCSITLKPMGSLCRGARSMIAEAFGLLANTMDRIQLCLEDKNSYLEYMIPCINRAYEDLNGLLERAIQLRHKFGKMLPIKILYSRCCFAVVMVQMQQQQDIIESNLLESNNYIE